tara:strand:- start:5311 stop:5808 length:498 start_codon:yes stop_codon:yes gene_type:complete
LQKSEQIKAWNNWVELNYSTLLNSSKKFHKDYYDLVHHVYLRVIRLKGVNIEKVMLNPFGYFNRTMYMEATRGKFKKDYKLVDRKFDVIQVHEYDMSRAFLLENFQLAADRLNWFDRTVLNLYCDGFNLSEVARESGIKASTFHTSLHRSKMKLKIHFNESTVLW